MPEGNQSGSLDPRVMFPPGSPMPEKLRMPDPTRPREVQQEQFLRDMELDGPDFYPPDQDRKIERVWPDDGIEMDVATLLKAKGVDLDDE